MYALVIGRAYPEKKTGMMGIFEYEQARAISNNGYKTVYAFCDTRSIKRLRKYGNTQLKKDETDVYGYHLPIGGIPKKVFNKVKGQYFKKILKKILEDHGVPKIVHVHFPLLTLTDDIWYILKSLKVPIVVTEHWTRVQTKEISSYYSNLLKKIVNEADVFICVGDPLRKSVVELTNTDKNIRVIPNMVSSMFFYEPRKSKDENFEFIAIGRLVEVKRFGLIIEAFSKAFLNNKNIKLTIVGGGPLFEDLKRRIRELNMHDRISMLGFLSREETANKLKNSDAYVSASVLETFGVPFIEAMACGKPVIGVEDGPIDKYINEQNGVLFKVDDIESLSFALSRVYENKNEYNQEEIAQKTQSIFSQNSIAEQLIGLYKQLT